MVHESNPALDQSAGSSDSILPLSSKNARAWDLPPASTLDSIANPSLDALKIPKNFLSYALSFPCYRSHKRSAEIEDLLLLWSRRSPVESLAGFSSVVDTAFGILKDAMVWDALHGSHAVAEEMFHKLSQDLDILQEQLTAVLRDPQTYQSFRASLDDRAQQLLDLLQDMLDLFPESNDRPLMSRALLRLSENSKLHPKCFALTGLQKVGEQVAAGGFADIWKGLVRGQSVCVKIMRLFEDTDINEVLKAFGREALIWRQLSHPNLLPFFGLYFLDKRLSLVSPWMSNGHILKFLKTAPHDTDRMSLIMDVAMGLEYLHKEKIVHGDLKAMNILVTPSRRACLADFGLSSIRGGMSTKFSHSTSSVPGGTARYQAPELLSHSTGNLDRFASDIYAFACVCYEILTEKPPFFELDTDIKVACQVLLNGLRPSRPKEMPIPQPDVMWDLLQDCWKKTPSDRPSVTQIIERLVDPKIGATANQSSAGCGTDWDDAFSSKWRRSCQDRPLLPSVTKIERRLFGDRIAEACATCFPQRPPPLQNQNSRAQDDTSLLFNIRGGSETSNPHVTLPPFNNLSPPPRKFSSTHLQSIMIPLSCIMNHYVQVGSGDRWCEVYVSTHDLELHLGTPRDLPPLPQLVSTPPGSPVRPVPMDFPTMRDYFLQMHSQPPGGTTTHKALFGDLDNDADGTWPIPPPFTSLPASVDLDCHLSEESQETTVDLGGAALVDDTPLPEFPSTPQIRCAAAFGRQMAR